MNSELRTSLWWLISASIKYFVLFEKCILSTFNKYLQSEAVNKNWIYDLKWQLNTFNSLGQSVINPIVFVLHHVHVLYILSPLGLIVQNSRFKMHIKHIKLILYFLLQENNYHRLKCLTFIHFLLLSNTWESVAIVSRQCVHYVFGMRSPGGNFSVAFNSVYELRASIL